MTPGDAKQPMPAGNAPGSPSNQGPARNARPQEGGNSTRKPFTREPFRKDRPRSGVQLSRTPDYLLIGHVTADLQPNGEVVLGGTALYSALTAAKLGARVAVLTRGVYGREVAGMKIPDLDQLAHENISIVVQEADVPTTFINEYQADRRVQTIPHWAGPIDLRGLPPHWRNAKVVHLGPIADEVDPRQASGLTSQFLGVTPQGWMRDWPRSTGGRVKHIPLKIPGELLGRIDSAIVSIEEIAWARDVIGQVGNRRLGVVTQGADGARIIAGGQRFELPGYKVTIKDLTGAGDVFAAAFFLKASDRTVSAETAGRFANAVAALSLREIGAFGVPSMKQVDELLAR
ncbi:MAG TPA: PfkB family carbohydrate kinase [Thermomicrobiales bacterium]|nr:PfkB family carbohydrate kinase [Thermomicrobiales bacterium]